MMWKLHTSSIAFLLHDIPQMLHVSRLQFLLLLCSSLLEVALLPSPVSGLPQHSQTRSGLCQGPSDTSVCGLLEIRITKSHPGFEARVWPLRICPFRNGSVELFTAFQKSVLAYRKKRSTKQLWTHWYGFLELDSPLSARVKQQIT